MIIKCEKNCRCGRHTAHHPYPSIKTRKKMSESQIKRGRCSMYCKCKRHRQDGNRYKYSGQYKRKLGKDGWNLLFQKQGGKCAICGVDQSVLKMKLCIDHDHKTEKIRGLLCWWCNLGLGYFRDKTNLLEEAIRYLRGNG
jgi:hypothetical protein